ncbi:MAG: DNA translocase FtsK 4TM domain-containing protein [Patescibacteria group bacterium]
MSRQKNSKKNKGLKPKALWHHALRPETKNSILAVFSFAVSFVLVLSAFGKAGVAGELARDFLRSLFGKGFWAAPLAFLIVGFSLLKDFEKKTYKTTIVGIFLFLISSLGALDLFAGAYAGGYVGFLSSYPMLRLFDFWVSAVIFVTLFAVSLIMMLNLSLRFAKKDTETEEGDEDENESPESLPADAGGKVAAVVTSAPQKTAQINSYADDSEGMALNPKKQISAQYIPPPPSLLEDDKGIPSSGDIKANANIIKRTLQNFGIDVEMFEVNVGPSVTQYTLKPAEGIKLSRITALHNDLALALAAHPLRIEAPIPGKSLVGVEVPNKSISLVGLRSLLSMQEFQESYALSISLGRDVSGKAVFADIAKMPHLLIAGATGSGKSIAIHTLIVSMLYKNSPEFLRFLMIDPKRVELSVYKEIPHLLTPVIVDAKKAVMSLRWAVKEMERRYEILSEAGSRDILSFNNQLIKANPPAGGHEEIMPNIVIIIDELADLMSTFPREVEASIVRLAQMSRAVGIHLVVSTQRPSVEVITGLIKANITARVALQVASGVDSRTILDMSGAEKLLGNGDMLYLAGDTSKPRRIQGAFISEKEIKKVVGHAAGQGEKFESEEIDIEAKIPSASLEVDGSDSADDDELYEEAKSLVMEADKASASFLQRRLRVGYARAARLLDIMENRGVIGPADGAKPREILIVGGNSESSDDIVQSQEKIKEETANWSQLNKL